MGGENVKQAERKSKRFRVVGRDEKIPLREYGDEALMLAHGEGSEAAFEELVRRHQRGVLNYMYRMVQNRHVAEELTQEVFLALVQNAQRYEPRAKFTTYLYAIASKIVAKEWARRKRRPRLLNFSLWHGHNQEDEYNPEECVRDRRVDVGAACEEGEINEAINRALQKLPEHMREAFVLSRFQELSQEEVSEIMKVPIGTIKSRIFRAERALRPLLEDFREYLEPGRGG